MIPGGPSAGDFFLVQGFLGEGLSNEHSPMNKHSKIDLPSRRVQDERQLFAAQIRAGRAVLGWSQTDLGERTGVTQRAIYRIEDGATRPRQLTRLRIEKAFGDAGVEFKRLQTGGFTMFVRVAAAGRAPAHPKLSPPRREAR
jgi:DNA-binding XRE family transcriptional regulator